MHDEPTPLRKLRPLYPLGLEEIIGRCLQRHPNWRFPNIADLATRLADFGPEHARFAVESIYELVEPSEPQAQVHLVDDEPVPSSTVAGGDTTLYLQGDQGGSSMRTAWGIGLAAATFAMGAGVGWVLSLPTDPTTRAMLPADDGAQPAQLPTAAVTSAEPPTRAAKAGSPPVAIDLDDPAGAAAPAREDGPQKATARSVAPPPKGASTARPKAAVSATSKSPPPLDETIEPGPTPPVPAPLPSAPAGVPSDIEF